MRCPFCANDDSQVKDSRPTEDGSAIRRRRQCPACGARFTTFERVQLRDLVVVKSAGRREAFDRDKLARSVELACRKRNIAPDRIERLVTGLVRRLESTGDTDVDSAKIGEMVMEGLATLDHVAYIRYASVYKDFREAEDFKNAVDALAPPEPDRAPDRAPELPLLAIRPK